MPGATPIALVTNLPSTSNHYHHYVILLLICTVPVSRGDNFQSSPIHSVHHHYHHFFSTGTGPVLAGDEAILAAFYCRQSFNVFFLFAVVIIYTNAKLFVTIFNVNN